MATAALEIIDIAIMTLALGYIFSRLIRAPQTRWQAFSEVQLSWWRKLFNFSDFRYALMIVAPAVVFHELGHKFVSIWLGFPAIFHGPLTGGAIVWVGTLIGIVMRVLALPFIFFIPGYVAPITASAWAHISPLQMSAIAFAGPAINLALFIAFWLLPKSEIVRRRLGDSWPKWARFFHISRAINLWLFIFNMLPIPPLDGSKVIMGLISAIR